MIQVKIDGQQLNLNLDNLKTMGELVELIKMSIDPDTVITGMSLNDRDLSESDWRSSLSSFSGKILQIATGSREQFLTERLEVASFYIDRIREEFTNAQASFKTGVTSDSHAKLSQAVNDLKAFVDWYESVIQMLPPGREDVTKNYHEQVKRITEVCEQILQQQLYRAWWALAETIERKLDPELERLKGQCLRAAANG